jgi:hypothetical protein
MKHPETSCDCNQAATAVHFREFITQDVIA